MGCVLCSWSFLAVLMSVADCIFQKWSQQYFQFFMLLQQNAAPWESQGSAPFPKLNKMWQRRLFETLRASLYKWWSFHHALGTQPLFIKKKFRTTWRSYMEMFWPTTTTMIWDGSQHQHLDMLTCQPSENPIPKSWSCTRWCQEELKWAISSEPCQLNMLRGTYWHLKFSSSLQIYHCLILFLLVLLILVIQFYPLPSSTRS